jgi:hypothetical protein
MTAPDPMTTPDATPVLLDPDQADDLRRLLGTIEDWLLHCTEDTREDLAEFLTALAWSAAPPERLATSLVADLGEHTVLLRQALARTRPDGESR